MSFQELVKYMTEQFVHYVETPYEQRMKKKQQKKAQVKNWRQHWFGMIPEAISMLFKKH